MVLSRVTSTVVAPLSTDINKINPSLPTSKHERMRSKDDIVEVEKFSVVFCGSGLTLLISIC